MVKMVSVFQVVMSLIIAMPSFLSCRACSSLVESFLLPFLIATAHNAHISCSKIPQHPCDSCDSKHTLMVITDNLCVFRHSHLLHMLNECFLVGHRDRKLWIRVYDISYWKILRCLSESVLFVLKFTIDWAAWRPERPIYNPQVWIAFSD